MNRPTLTDLDADNVQSAARMTTACLDEDIDDAAPYGAVELALYGLAGAVVGTLVAVLATWPASVDLLGALFMPR